VTQWQVVGCVERISERFLLPVLRKRPMNPSSQNARETP